MNTLSELEDFVQSEFNDTSAPTQVLLRIAVKAAIDRLTAKTPFSHDQKSITRTTVAGTFIYNVAVDHLKMDSISILYGGTTYQPRKVVSDRHWDRLIEGQNSFTSDIPAFYRVRNRTIEIFPTPAAGGAVMTINYYARAPRLVDADFEDQTSGTVSIASAATAVTGVSTAFLASDPGRYIIFTGGDRNPYRIASRSSATALALAQAYEGSTVAGISYILGTIPRIAVAHPEAMFVIANFVLWRLWIKREEVTALAGKASHFKMVFEDGEKELMKSIKDEYADTDAEPLDGDDEAFDPNLHPYQVTA